MQQSTEDQGVVFSVDEKNGQVKLGDQLVASRVKINRKTVWMVAPSLTGDLRKAVAMAVDHARADASASDFAAAIQAAMR